MVENQEKIDIGFPIEVLRIIVECLPKGEELILNIIMNVPIRMGAKEELLVTAATLLQTLESADSKDKEYIIYLLLYPEGIPRVSLAHINACFALRNSLYGLGAVGLVIEYALHCNGPDWDLRNLVIQGWERKKRDLRIWFDSVCSNISVPIGNNGTRVSEVKRIGMFELEIIEAAHKGEWNVIKRIIENNEKFGRFSLGYHKIPNDTLLTLLVIDFNLFLRAVADMQPGEILSFVIKSGSLEHLEIFLCNSESIIFPNLEATLERLKEAGDEKRMKLLLEFSEKTRV